MVRKTKKKVVDERKVSSRKTYKGGYQGKINRQNYYNNNKITEEHVNMLR